MHDVIPFAIFSCDNSSRSQIDPSSVPSSIRLSVRLSVCFFVRLFVCSFVHPFVWKGKGTYLLSRVIPHLEGERG